MGVEHNFQELDKKIAVIEEKMNTHEAKIDSTLNALRADQSSMLAGPRADQSAMREDQSTFRASLERFNAEASKRETRIIISVIGLLVASVSILVWLGAR